jgi:hypothetical protein
MSSICRILLILLCHGLAGCAVGADRSLFLKEEFIQFKQQFQTTGTPIDQASSYFLKEEGKELTGRNREICLSLFARATGSGEKPLADGLRCIAANRFPFGENIEAFEVVIPRGQDPQKYERVGRALALFRDGLFVDSVLAADYQRGGDLTHRIDSIVEDVDKDGFLDLLRQDFRVYGKENDEKQPVGENSSMLVSWNGNQFIYKTLKADDPVIKKFVAALRWKIYGEPILPSYVEESEDGYSIVLADGKKLFLKNNPGDDESYQVYSYTPSPLEPSLVLFTVHLYESGYVAWVDRATGAISSIPSTPLFSPSGKRFVMATNYDDEDYNYKECVMEVWRLSKENVSKEYSLSCTEDMVFAGQPAWETEDAITFDKKIRDAEGSLVVRTRSRIVFDGKEWRERDK